MEKEKENVNNYYVAFIIVTIIGFALSIILSIYFVYLPAQRAASKFDNLYQKGTEIIDGAVDIAEEVNVTASTTSDFLVALCDGIYSGTDNGILGVLIDSFEETCEFIKNQE